MTPAGTRTGCRGCTQTPAPWRQGSPRTGSFSPGRLTPPGWCPGAPPASSPACQAPTGSRTWTLAWPAWKMCPESRKEQSWTCNVKANFQIRWSGPSKSSRVEHWYDTKRFLALLHTATTICRFDEISPKMKPACGTSISRNSRIQFFLWGKRIQI